MIVLHVAAGTSIKTAADGRRAAIRTLADVLLRAIPETDGLRSMIKETLIRSLQTAVR